MRQVALVMVGGSLGALLRYLTGLLAARHLGSSYAWGTLIVNLLGCFLIGVCFELADRRAMLGQSARLLLVTGFLGAMTTFSTYALESVGYAREGSMGLMVANVVANNVGGGLLLLAGMWIAWRLA
jgi:CrcB protein